MGCLRQGCVVSVVPERIGNVVDTVGAGDAFAAVSILGLLHNWTIEDLMSRAEHHAAGFLKLDAHAHAASKRRIRSATIRQIRFSLPLDLLDAMMMGLRGAKPR